MSPTILLYVFFLSVSSASSPTRSYDASSAWPSNIWVQDGLRSHVARLWQGSPTFRAQVEKIAAHRRYQVHIVVDAAMTYNRRCRAQCVIKTFSSGIVMARVSLPDFRDLPELIPHELEHISEHIDGINLKREIQRRTRGVYDVGDGRLESVRALDAGRQAHAEMATVQVTAGRIAPPRR